MLFLLLSILSSTVLVMIFKFFPKFGIDTFQAIVANYFVCVICGTLVLGRFPFSAETLSEPWLPYASLLGIFFISGFYAVAMTVLFFGLTVASVLQKMTLVISVPYAIIAFSEPATTPKIIGIILALGAVILSNWPSKKEVIEPAVEQIKQQKPSNFLIWFFPIYAFLASGAIECGIQFVEGTILTANSDAAAEFSSGIFASAGILGTLTIVYLLITKKTKLSAKNLLAGVALGIPNYFSIFFLIKSFGWWDKSIVLPINNIAIVGVSALLGVLLFNEKLSKINWIGVGLATFAILLISLKFS